MRFLILFAFLTPPAIAQTTVAPAPASAEKKVCRQGPTPTGSMMAARRTCHTPSEWAAIDAGGKSARDQAQRELDNRRAGPMGN